MRIDHKGEWDDAFHYTQHPYICEYRGRFLVSAEKKTWHDAKEECRQAGLELAKIRSDQDLEVRFTHKISLVVLNLVVVSSLL